MKSHVFPLGGQALNNDTISLGLNIHDLLVYLEIFKWMMSVKMGHQMWRLGGIKSGSQTLCFSLEKLCWHSAVVHLCQFENAPTHDWEARKRQEGLSLASSGRSHSWPRRDDVIARATGSKMNQSAARSINNEPHVMSQFWTQARYFAFIVMMSWFNQTEVDLRNTSLGISLALEQRALVVLCTSLPLLCLTVALRCNCCSLHLHWGGCVKSCTTHLTLYYSPPEHTQSLLNYLQAIHLCWQTCSNCCPFLRPDQRLLISKHFQEPHKEKKRNGPQNVLHLITFHQYFWPSSHKGSMNYC